MTRPALNDADFVDRSVEFVIRLTGSAFARDQLRSIATDPLLEQKARGSLLLLREDLTESARRSLIDAIHALASTTCSHDVHHAACWCADVLGENEAIRPSRRFLGRR